MAIDLTNPIVLPAVQQRAADKVWVLSMNVNATRGATAPVTATFRVAPYVSTTGEILSDQTQPIIIPDVFAACAANPKLAMAMGAIYNAVAELCKQKGLYGMQPDPVQPAITAQPSAVTVTEGQQATFGVLATGGQLSYRWAYDGTPVTGSSRISGSGAPVLTINNAQMADSGSYTITVTNTAGTITSQPASLTVVPLPPVITQQPISSSVNVGETATFNVEATSSVPISYQWQNSIGVLSDTGSYSGTQTATLTISGSQLTDAESYSVVVSNSGGSTTSNIAILQVNAP